MMGHRFRPEHVEKLDNPERRRLLPPLQILAGLQIGESHVVADIGCGIGYFTIPAAKQTQENVYAVDIEQKMLEYLGNRIQPEGIKNITAMQGSAESLPLPSCSVDRMIYSLILHEVDDLKATLREMKRILRKDGRVLMIEWEKKETQSGPPVEHRIAATDLLDKLEEAGFDCRATKPNSDQYAIIADLSCEL